MATIGDDTAPATLRPSPRDAKGDSLLKYPMILTSSCFLKLKMHAISSSTGRDISASPNDRRLLLYAGGISLRFVNTSLLPKERTTSSSAFCSVLQLPIQSLVEYPKP